ncbi:MAG: S8 family serine peptidase [Verrucomicrobiota bacterium]
MKIFLTRLWVLLLLLGLFDSRAANTLNWQTGKDRVSADIQSAELLRVLEGVAKLTGWQVFVESNCNSQVSVKFQDVPSGDALRRLLGDLNYALVPATNSSSRLYVFRTTRANATILVKPGDINPGSKLQASKIPNELIVRVKPGVDIEELAKKLGAKVLGKIESLNAYRLQFPDEAAANAALAKLTGNPDVAGVENNYRMEQPPLVTRLDSGTGLPSPVQLQLNPPGESGRVVVGLIDTAVQLQGSDLEKFLTKSISVAGEPATDSSGPSHGTSMFQDILRGVSNTSGASSSVQILSVDVYGADPLANSFNVATGIAAAINNGANIINLSLGSENDSQVLRDIITQATQKGIPVFAAAGNNASAQPFYPAAYSSVISVTAGNNGQLAPYANYADYIKLMLPGSGVVYYNNQPYLVSGTSTSSAFTSGLAAGFADSKRVNPPAAASALLNTTSIRFNPK